MKNNKYHTADRRFFLLCAIAAAPAMAGCSSLLAPPGTPGAIYPLSPPPPAGTQGSPVDWALAIGLPECADSLDTQRIAITKADGTIDYYADAMWPDPAPALIQTALLAAFQESGRIAAVARGQDSLHADYQLAVDMRDFSAHYSRPGGNPDAMVRLVVQMVTVRGRRIVAHFAVTKTVAATANSIPTAVAALAAAVGAAASDIVNWALALPPPAASSQP